jgi:type II secretory pathway pseudopilin PulG
MSRWTPEFGAAEPRCSPWPASAAERRRSRRRRAGGFALIEVGLVLLILFLASWLAVDLLGWVQQRRRGDRFVADLREFAAAFQSYAQQHHAGLPASTGDAAMPASMENLLKDTNWRKGSPFGGTYEWLAPYPPNPSAEGAGQDGHGSGAIMLTAFAPSFPLTLSRHDLLFVDARIDDGNPATGRFRTGFNGWPLYLIGKDR